MAGLLALEQRWNYRRFQQKALARSGGLLENTIIINAWQGLVPIWGLKTGKGYMTTNTIVWGRGPGTVLHNVEQDAEVLEQGS